MTSQRISDAGVVGIERSRCGTARSPLDRRIPVSGDRVTAPDLDVGAVPDRGDNRRYGYVVADVRRSGYRPQQGP